LCHAGRPGDLLTLGCGRTPLLPLLIVTARANIVVLLSCLLLCCLNFLGVVETRTSCALQKPTRPSSHCTNRCAAVAELAFRRCACTLYSSPSSKASEQNSPASTTGVDDSRSWQGWTSILNPRCSSRSRVLSLTILGPYSHHCVRNLDQHTVKGAPKLVKFPSAIRSSVWSAEPTPTPTVPAAAV
jgi:hypothetical protein